MSSCCALSEPPTADIIDEDEGPILELPGASAVNAYDDEASDDDEAETEAAAASRKAR